MADTKHFQLKKKVKNQGRERYGVPLFLVLAESFRQFCETFSRQTVQLEMSNILKLHNTVSIMTLLLDVIVGNLIKKSLLGCENRQVETNRCHTWKLPCEGGLEEN